jgi:hypothetical protein
LNSTHRLHHSARPKRIFARAVVQSAMQAIGIAGTAYTISSPRVAYWVEVREREERTEDWK